MSAVISACGRYRYRLERDVQPTGLVFAYFGVNPSTADALVEDATTRKWAGFARENGARRYIAGNLFAYRATDVRELNAVVDPIGPDNIEAIAGIIDAADVLIPCWGSAEKLPHRLRAYAFSLLKVLVDSGKPVKVFGFTASGDPKHPLMLAYRTPLVDLTSARS